MTSKPLKILCFHNTPEICDFVGAVYSAIPHQIDSISTTPVKLWQKLKTNDYDLLIADNKSNTISPNDLKKIQLTHTAVDTIIIQDNYDELEAWLDIKNVRIITHGDVNKKLPILLGEIYSNVNERLMRSLDYNQLLRNCLYEVDSLVVVLNRDAKIIFLNRSGESLLGVSDHDYLGKDFIDFMIDGSKVWKYLEEYCYLEGNDIENYQITFKSLNQSDHEKQISARLTEDKNYIMIQSLATNKLSSQDADEKSYELLERFADSIANELLNPVNIISGRLQLMQDKMKSDETYQNNLLGLDKQVRRMTETVSKLLTFARLRQDSIPQKIHVNEVLQHLLLEPSINRLIEKEEVALNYTLGSDLPILSGLISHIELLIKTIIELSFDCLGSEGSIHIETNTLEGHLNKNWLKINFTLTYSYFIFSQGITLHSYLKPLKPMKKIKSIESTIVRYILHHYNGTYQLDKEDENIERLTLLFPVKNSKSNLGVK